MWYTLCTEHGCGVSVEAAAAQPAEVSGGGLRAQHTLGSAHVRFCGIPALLYSRQLGAARTHAAQAAAGGAPTPEIPVASYP